LFLAEANDGGAFGVGRTIRATDGEVLNVPDFSSVYQARIRTIGRSILARDYAGGNVTIHLYDILKGNDAWSKKFQAGSHVLHTEDQNITGVIEPNGKLTVLDARTGDVLLESSVVQGRITPEDLKTLRDGILLQDSERFYVALNKPIDGRVGGGMLHNNFNNGTRCLNVNGWFLALHRQAGKKTVGDREVAWNKGDLAWHSYMPMQNQMIVLDQFDQSPIILFTVRYNEIMANGGNRWVSVTQSIHKANGKMVYDSGAVQTNGAAPMFTALQMDLKTRTINLIGFARTVQHYIDDGKGPPPAQGALNMPAGINQGNFGYGSAPAGVGQAVPPRPVPVPVPNVRIRANGVQVLPAQVLPPIADK
jgi:hypothetical protein